MTRPAAPDTILVALVDDNRISRDEHERLLNAEEGVTVVSAEATLTVAMLADEQPDVVLVEAAPTEMAPLQAAVTTRRMLPDASVVITDLVPANDHIADFVKAGVAGFVLKEATAGDLVDTVRTVADGSHVLPDALTSPLFEQIAAEGIELGAEPAGKRARPGHGMGLTAREAEVVALVRRGFANKEIAMRLAISTHTVKSHIRSAMKKAGTHTRLLLALSTVDDPVEVPGEASGAK
jgi:DNA-binding NarL/FixJ family response regulator